MPEKQKKDTSFSTGKNRDKERKTNKERKRQVQRGVEPRKWDVKVGRDKITGPAGDG